MNKLLFALLLALTGVGSLLSCHKNKPENAQSWGFHSPDYFPPTVYDMDSKQSYALFVLGRELFYEDSLSSTNAVNCGTCHHPTHAFSAHNTALTEGVNGLVGTRNAPAIFNMAWSPVFMWDGRIHDIESMPIAPITNPVEMNESFDHILQKLSGSSTYRNMFLTSSCNGGSYRQPHFTGAGAIHGHDHVHEFEVRPGAAGKSELFGAGAAGL